MNIKSEFKNIDLVEVIYPTLDGNIYFLNLEDGKPTRNPINIGFSTKGTGMIDPRDIPSFTPDRALTRMVTISHTMSSEYSVLLIKPNCFL